ncbi:hypothetical protein [Thalassococcus sp. S3]|uniref:hypothetical protein n=1 Tax=Thalassococcus sp. S3 TaxID=2017482 RepID=UPI0010244A0E|nr:hypothetical protein [Thalassococcus sp. S3]QBF32238.1 hypothetical protein CFI11_13555 [Thalassococcus sp. S3]
MKKPLLLAATTFTIVAIASGSDARGVRCGNGPFNSGDSCVGARGGPDARPGRDVRQAPRDRDVGPGGSRAPTAVAVGRRIPASGLRYVDSPRAYGLGPLGPRQRYAIYRNNIYLIDSDTLAVLGLVRVLDRVLD